MIAEIRHLLFQDDDLIRALVEYKKKRNEPLPPGSIIGFKTEVDQQIIRCILKICPDKCDEKIDFSFEHEEIREALIMYCLYKKIPLPAKVRKNLRMFGDRVGLFIALNLSHGEIKHLQRLAG